MPLGLHWPELIGLMVVMLLIFGAKRLPEIGSAAGQTIREFQKSMREIKEPSTDQAALPPAQEQQPTTHD